MADVANAHNSQGRRESHDTIMGDSRARARHGTRGEDNVRAAAPVQMRLWFNEEIKSA